MFPGFHALDPEGSKQPKGRWYKETLEPKVDHTCILGAFRNVLVEHALRPKESITYSS